MDLQLGSCLIGDDRPCFIIAEIGINHNGDLAMAMELIEVAARTGCNAVKFQKRTPDLCVPDAQKGVLRETPWGIMTYLDYRKRVEFEQDDYQQIDAHCRKLNIQWTASAWDLPSLHFLEQFDLPFYKVCSAHLTNQELLAEYCRQDKPTLISTGMSSMEELDWCADYFGEQIPWMFLHCVSTYPAAPEEVNLNNIAMLRTRYGRPAGYSGHEVGLQISLAAVALGACVLERHITLDRTFWGTDQAASLEPGGLQRLVRDVRIIEAARGRATRVIQPNEMPIRKKLRTHFLASSLQNNEV